MSKKINCKHGLDKRDEIEARRLKTKILAEDKNTLFCYHMLWIKSSTFEKTFEDFLKEENIVLYSAYVRACQAKDKNFIFDAIMRTKD